MTAPTELPAGHPAKAAPRRALRRLPGRGAFAVATIALFLLVAQAAAPSPLFGLYVSEWGLSAAQISVVFTSYIGGLALTLLTTGALSDHVGRRPVILAALGLALTAMTVLLFAEGFGGLVVARVLQGLASGIGMGTLGAALLDYSPTRRHGLVATLNGSVPPLALGCGALFSGVMAEYFPHPLRLAYLVLGAGLLLALLAALVLPDTPARRAGAWKSLTPRLAVPAASRGRFAVAAVALAGSWSIVGLYMGIGADATRVLLGITSASLGALVMMTVCGSGALAGILTVRLGTHAVIMIGAVLLLAGAAGYAGSEAYSSAPLYFIAAALSGLGYGAAFQGGLRLVLEGLDPAHRGAMISALYLIAYMGYGLPTLAGGFVADRVGLQPVLFGYAGLIGLLALASLGCAGLHLRARARCL